MPTGPKGQKRPADVIGNAVKIARIATGEEEDVLAPTPEAAGEDDPAAVVTRKKLSGTSVDRQTPVKAKE